MNLRLILTIFLAGVLLFGCTSGGTKTTDNTKTGPGPVVNNTQPGKSNETPSGNGGSTTPNDGNKNGSNDLADIAWSGMIALGAPLECDLKYKDPTLVPGFEKATMYIKGNKFKETVTTAQAGVVTTTTIISNNDGFLYMIYDPAMMQTLTQGKIACAGIKTEVNITDSPSTEATTADTSTFEDSSKVQFSCKPGLFGDDIFQVTGKFCTMKEITTALTGGVDYCAQITDPQTKAQCQQALGG